MLRTAISALLFGTVWGLLEWKPPGAEPVRQWVLEAVTQDMDFHAVEAWYEKSFGGSPSFLPIFGRREQTQEVSAGWTREESIRPIAGRIVQTFAQSGTGVRIAAAGGSPVRAVHAGRVMQVSRSGGGGYTLMLQHASQMVTIYGNVTDVKVKANDWVEAGQQLGVLKLASAGDREGMLYFAIQQNGTTIDPTEVVPFD